MIICAKRKDAVITFQIFIFVKYYDYFVIDFWFFYVKTYYNY